MEYSLETDIVDGSGELVITDAHGDEIARESLDAASATVEGLLRPIQAGTLKLSVQLDRFDGSFDLLAKEGPPPEGGEDNGSGGADGGGEDNANGNETSGEDADLDDSEGIPGPGIVVLLVLLAGVLQLKRRR